MKVKDECFLYIATNLYGSSVWYFNETYLEDIMYSLPTIPSLLLFYCAGADPVRRDGRVVPPGEEERQELRLRLHQAPDQRRDQGRGAGQHSHQKGRD